MRIARTGCIFLVAIAIAFAVSQSQAPACPFCAAPSLTLSEQVSQSDAVVLVTWVEGTRASVAGRDRSLATTTYKIKKCLRGDKAQWKSGTRITLARYRVGKKGDQYLLFGSKGAVMEWGSPLEVSATSYKYISEAPGPQLAPTKRLAYFLNYLEHSDTMVANDAYAEFANAPYKDIVPVAKMLSSKKVRHWVTSEKTPVTRHGLYGLLLGLSGTEDDAKFMEKRILEPTEDFRLGIDGLISGFLLLTGPKGLDVIDQAKLKNPYLVDSKGKFVLDKQGEKIAVPFSETYSAMQSLRFMWTYGDGRISKDRLRQSMRVLLSRPELSDLVIADLARWKDWSVQDRLMGYYGADDYNIPSIKRAIVRYMLAATKDMPKGDDVPMPEHVRKAKKNLAELRESDPKTVREAERFFFLR